MNSYHIIVLNLERSTDRRTILEKQFKKLGITNYTFFPCFDGKNIINASFTASIIKGTGMGRKLTTAEISIIMSHLGALKFIQAISSHSEYDLQYAKVIVLEDDVVICEDWKARLDLLISMLPIDWEYVYLAGHSDFVKLPMYEKPTIIPAPKMIGAFSYMINRVGLEKLIKYCGEFTTTYDDMIMHKIQSGKLKAYLFIPFMTYHADSMSTLWDIPSVNHPSKNYFKNKLND
jgi:GR25 family glycosyltransferase involved in LPS biosynthesis